MHRLMMGMLNGLLQGQLVTAHSQEHGEVGAACCDEHSPHSSLVTCACLVLWALYHLDVILCLFQGTCGPRYGFIDPVLTSVAGIFSAVMFGFPGNTETCGTAAWKKVKHP